MVAQTSSTKWIQDEGGTKKSGKKKWSESVENKGRGGEMVENKKDENKKN